MKELFKKGALREALVAPTPLDPGSWTLTVVCQDGAHEELTLWGTNGSQTKHYKRMQTAISDAKKIGFHEVKVRV